MHTRNIEMYKDDWETEQQCKKRAQKLYNIKDEELKNGNVKIRIMDKNKMFSGIGNSPLARKIKEARNKDK